MFLSGAFVNATMLLSYTSVLEIYDFQDNKNKANIIYILLIFPLNTSHLNFLFPPACIIAIFYVFHSCFFLLNCAVTISTFIKIVLYFFVALSSDGSSRPCGGSTHRWLNGRDAKTDEEEKEAQ